MKSLTNFYWPKISFCLNCIYDSQDLPVVFVDCLLKIARVQKFREKGNLKHIYRNELDKACFAHDAAYSDSKDLAKRTVSDKILKDRAYEIAINPNMMDIKKE